MKVGSLESGIKVTGIRKTFLRRPVLDNLSFSANSGEIVGIVGQNGAGKTTFLRILATLIRVDRGDININGLRLPQDAAVIRQWIGFISHQSLLYGELTAVENLRFYARLYGIAQAEKQIQYVLHTIELAHRQDDPVRVFSRGTQQRLALGRAILHDPTILLLDEPFSGLDPSASAFLEELISRAAGEGKIVILTGHDLAGVEKTGTRFDFLHNGSFVESIHKSQLPEGGLNSAYQNILLNQKPAEAV